MYSEVQLESHRLLVTMERTGTDHVAGIFWTHLVNRGETFFALTTAEELHILNQKSQHFVGK